LSVRGAARQIQSVLQVHEDAQRSEKQRHDAESRREHAVARLRGRLDGGDDRGGVRAHEPVHLAEHGVARGFVLKDHPGYRERQHDQRGHGDGDVEGQRGAEPRNVVGEECFAGAREDAARATEQAGRVRASHGALFDCATRPGFPG
jgi:hypothetical protein